MLTLTKPYKVGDKTNLHFQGLESLPCGLFRVNLSEAKYLLPELWSLYESAPVENPEDWEIDVKIHMLMKNQYPCIPNWHCDNVIRNDGVLNYQETQDNNSDMFIWLSTGPTTEFLVDDLEVDAVNNHGDLKNLIGDNITQKIDTQQWYKFDRLSPHRGTLSKVNQWRIFARLTRKEILPCRPVISSVRRHCQVYLDSNNFTW